MFELEKFVVISAYDMNTAKRDPRSGCWRHSEVVGPENINN